MLKEKSGPYYNARLTASSGCFKQFKNYYLLHNVHVTGEFVSADVEATEEFLENFR